MIDGFEEMIFGERVGDKDGKIEGNLLSIGLFVGEFETVRSIGEIFLLGGLKTGPFLVSGFGELGD